MYPLTKKKPSKTRWTGEIAKKLLQILRKVSHSPDVLQSG